MRERGGCGGAQFKPFNWQTLPEWQPTDACDASPFAAAALQDPKREDSIMLVRACTLPHRKGPHNTSHRLINHSHNSALSVRLLASTL